MGLHVVATRGAAKSRLLGWVIAWQDFLRGISTVIFDVSGGGAIDGFIQKMLLLPRDYQERLFRRVIYVDMAGSNGYIVPFPLYYRLGNESLYEISQRFLDLLRKTDPALQSASIQGWNALSRIGTYTGMVFSALGCQIAEAEDLIRNPTNWTGRLNPLAELYPEIRPAIAFFTEEFPRWNEQTRASQTGSFLNKNLIFLDPRIKAMYGAPTPGIDWQQVVDEGLIVLLDFRNQRSLDQLKFAMLWAYSYLLEFVKQRGPGRRKPISLITDELAYLLSFDALGKSLFAPDLDDLVNRISRAHAVWLTVAHQELYQFDEKIQKIVMSLGTQIIGSTTDPEAARYLASRFSRFNPKRIKKKEPIYVGDRSGHYVIDYRTVEYSLDEQRELDSFEFIDLARYRFLVSAAPTEGETGSKFYPISIERFDKGIFVDEELVAKARLLLSQRDGRKISDLITEIDQRQLARAPRLISRRAQS